MIKQKFLKVLIWFREHLHFLVEVVIRLSLGIENRKVDQDNKKGDTND